MAPTLPRQSCWQWLHSFRKASTLTSEPKQKTSGNILKSCEHQTDPNWTRYLSCKKTCTPAMKHWFNIEFQPMDMSKRYPSVLWFLFFSTTNKPKDVRWISLCVELAPQQTSRGPQKTSEFLASAGSLTQGEFVEGLLNLVLLDPCRDLLEPSTEVVEFSIY